MSAYEVTVSLTPVCTSCGKDLVSGMTLGNGTASTCTAITLTKQRFFVYPCEDCFVFKGDLPKPEVQP